MDLEIGDRVVVDAKNRHSDGTHGIVEGFNETPGVLPRIVVGFSRGPTLTYRRQELRKEYA